MLFPCSFFDESGRPLRIDFRGGLLFCSFLTVFRTKKLIVRNGAVPGGGEPPGSA